MSDPYKGTVYEGLDPMFAARLKAMVDSSGGRISVGNGYRSYERQKQLWRDALAKYGSPAAARKWVADPDRGKGSNHMHGLAADLKFEGDGVEWAHRNAARFGLFFPMSWENWHIEPVRTTLGDDWNPDAYTTPPIGQPEAGDPRDPAFQMTRVLAMLDADLMGALAGPGDPTAAMDPQDTMVEMAPAGGTVEMDDGAAMQTWGFTEDPKRIEEQMEEQGLGND